ncbi:hypothetical protein Zm00014a_001850 [Zea mays]|jgi:hypothetical protein|uniref:Uncharacterized protein n=2 Tax=Zea mays TaxID=4577 RepID=B6SJ91_MAIZE|nr:uncharacterized protein LOC100274790 [Zea mays]ACG24924.1 hypothetical protein [Zea mays]AQL04551.1 hypothetical protein ZEAMMB73_Zm00001d046574 [Zea mays]PWZ07350.1 hypothetical protein Zm00014a_001850 [Zea mays]|eukprot:NP_001142543.1 uncharacterized protein LOC100274790 [Zea mays]
MDAAGEASSPSSPSKLRDKLRTTVCCCFGAGGGPERTRWRRRGAAAAAGEFRYDALSYALNFDEGDDDDAYADPAAVFRYRNFNARLPSSPAAAAAVGTQRQHTTAIA